MKNNWNPVIGSLLKVLQDHHFVLDSVNDGEEEFPLKGTQREQRQEAKKVIASVDVSDLYVRHPSHDKLMMLMVVLGNSPEETVADHSSWPILELAVDQFSKKWRGIPCPQS